MNWKKITIILGLVMAGLAAAAVIVIVNYDYNTFKPAIADLVKDATGRDLTLNGDLKLELGLSPSLVIEDVSFQNAEWGSQPAMVKVKKFEMALALMPLLSRSVQIKRFVLVEPDILIEKDKEGRSNLAFNTSGKQDAPPETVEANSNGNSSEEKGNAPPLSLTFEKLQIENGKLRFKDDANKQEITLALNSMNATSKGGDSPVTLSLKGMYNKTSFEISGALGWLDGLLAPDKPWPVDLNIKIADTVITAKGKIQEPAKPQGIDLAISVEGSSTAKLAAAADVKDVPDVGPFKISCKVSDPQPGAIGLSDLNLSVQAGGASLTAQGGVKDVTKPNGFNIKAVLSGNSLPETGKRFQVQNLPDIGPFKVSFNASDPAPKKFQVSDLSVTFQKSDLKGMLTADLNGKRPKLTADLSSKFIDLRPFMAESSTGTGGKEGGTKEKTSKKRAGKVFPNDPLPFDTLKKMDAKVKVRADEVFTPKLALNNLSVDADLENGKLRINPLSSVIGGSKLKAKMEINARKGTPRISNKLDIKQIDLGEMLKEKGEKAVIQGMLDVHMNVTGSGNTVAGIMGTLNGSTVVSMAEGVIDNRYMDLLSLGFTKQVFNQVIGLLGKKENQTVINCFLLNTDIKNGIANIAPMILDTPDMMLAGSGKVNLKTEGLDLSIQPKQKKGIAGVNLNLGELTKLFKLSGTLANPSLAIDPVQTTVAIGRFLGGYAAFGAAGAAAAILKSDNVKDHPCVNAFEALESGQKQESAQDKAIQPVKKTVESVQETVESVGKGLLDIFGGSKKK